MAIPQITDIIDGGRYVLCDACDCDGDETDDKGTPLHMGGGINGGSAYCQECADKYGDCRQLDPKKTFGDNVRAVRMEETGSDHAITIICTW